MATTANILGTTEDSLIWVVVNCFVNNGEKYLGPYIDTPEGRASACEELLWVLDWEEGRSVTKHKDKLRMFRTTERIGFSSLQDWLWRDRHGKVLFGITIHVEDNMGVSWAIRRVRMNKPKFVYSVVIRHETGRHYKGLAHYEKEILPELEYAYLTTQGLCLRIESVSTFMTRDEALNHVRETYNVNWKVKSDASWIGIVWKHKHKVDMVVCIKEHEVIPGGAKMIPPKV